MNHELLTAYCRTRYMVYHHSASLEVYIGKPPPGILQHFNWWLLTADNPHSERLTSDHNRRRRSWLRKIVLANAAAGHWRAWSTCAQAVPRASWPDERGWLITGCTESGILALAARLQQNAVLAYRSPGTTLLCTDTRPATDPAPTVELIPVEYRA